MSRFQALKVRAARLTSCAVADALDRLGAWNVLDYRVRAQNPTNEVLFGQAYTVHWEPTRKQADIRAPRISTWKDVRDFLVPTIDDGSGKIYVSGAGRLVRDMALAGGVSCSYFEAIGFEGVWMGGAVRDVHMISRLNMPVYASNPIPADTQGAYRVAAIGTWTIVESTRISTGDWLLADASGSVVIPDSIVDEAFASAESVMVEEETVLSLARSGGAIHRAIDDSGHI